MSRGLVFGQLINATINRELYSKTSAKFLFVTLFQGKTLINYDKRHLNYEEIQEPIRMREVSLPHSKYNSLTRQRRRGVVWFFLKRIGYIT